VAGQVVAFVGNAARTVAGDAEVAAHRDGDCNGRRMDAAHWACHEHDWRQIT
jgi:hypothetical protein